jgi:hypothetical protein
MNFHFPALKGDTILAFAGTEVVPVWMSDKCENYLDMVALKQRGLLLFKSIANSPITLRELAGLDASKVSYWFLGELYISQVVEEACDSRSKRGKYFVTLSSKTIPHWYK